MLNVQVLHIHLVNFLASKTLTLKNSPFTRYPPLNKLVENNKVQSMLEYFCVPHLRQALTGVCFCILDKVVSARDERKVDFNQMGESTAYSSERLWVRLNSGHSHPHIGPNGRVKSQTPWSYLEEDCSAVNMFLSLVCGLRHSLKMEWVDLLGSLLYICSHASDLFIIYHIMELSC